MHNTGAVVQSYFLLHRQKERGAGKGLMDGQAERQSETKRQLSLSCAFETSEPYLQYRFSPTRPKLLQQGYILPNLSNPFK